MMSCRDLKDWSVIFVVVACVKFSWHRGLEQRFLISLWHLAMYNSTFHDSDVVERDE